MSRSEPTTEHVLLELAALADSAAEDVGWGQPPWLLRVVLPDGPGAPLELAVRPLPAGVHPLAVLDGWLAPPEWDGLGVVAEGHAHALAAAGAPRRARQPARRTQPGPPRPRTSPPPPRRARVVHLVARDGVAVTGLRLAGEAFTVAPDDRSGPPGALAAAVRRSLALPAFLHLVGGVR